jgi:hypothetical protein
LSALLAVRPSHPVSNQNAAPVRSESSCDSLSYAPGCPRYDYDFSLKPELGISIVAQSKSPLNVSPQM